MRAFAYVMRVFTAQHFAAQLTSMFSLSPAVVSPSPAASPSRFQPLQSRLQPLQSRLQPLQAMFVVLALLGSTLVAQVNAVSAQLIGPDLGTTGEQDYLPSTVACVGPAKTDREFSDVSDKNVFYGAINCLAYYGITVGTGQDKFSPNLDVTRGQMVRFMTRTARLTGANPQGVLGNFPAAGSPKDLVRRDEMAQLLARLLILSTNHVSPYNVTVDATGDMAINGLSDFGFFTDVRFPSSGRYDSTVDKSVSVIYEMGVTKGRGGGTYFDPEGTVTRGQMAAFITRALAHTRVRPEGLTIQINRQLRDRISVSVRDSSFRPVAGRHVDVFVASSQSASRVFTSDGACNSGEVSKLGGESLCRIDNGDIRTDAYGDVLTLPVNFDLSSRRSSRKNTTVYVWVWDGKRGERIAAGSSHVGLLSLTVKQGEDEVFQRCPKATGGVRVLHFAEPQASCINENSKYVAVFDTSEGEMRFTLDTKKTPGTVNNFVALARWGYYNGTLIFHGEPNIDIIQGGSPHTQNAGDPGPGYTIKDEPTMRVNHGKGGRLEGDYKYVPGQLVMARTAARNSASAQFFITTGSNAARLNNTGIYVVFGQMSSKDTPSLTVAKKIMNTFKEGRGQDSAPTKQVTVYSISIEET